MKRVGLVVVAVAMACGSSSTSKPAGGPPGTSAQDHERAIGGPRDYELAVAAHRRACAGGRGDLAACDAVLEAIGDARGVARSTELTIELAAAMCKSGDDIGCGLKYYLGAIEEGRRGRRQRPDPAAEAVFRRIDAACERDEPRACRFLMSLAPGGDGGAAEERRLLFNALGCRQDHVPSCNALLWEVRCDSDDDATCVRKQIDEWRAVDYRAIQVDAYDRLVRLCDAGDAMACQDYGGRPLSDEELCAAKDYGACAHRACFGDEAAAAVARANNALGNCNVAYQRAMKHWRRSNADVPPPVPADDLERVNWYKPTEPLEFVAPVHHGGRDALGWPRIDLHNFGTAPVLSARVCVYIYDQHGTQLARRQETVTQRIPPRGKLALVLTHPPDAKALGRDHVSDDVAIDRVEAEGMPVAEDKSRCPEQKPFER